MYWPTLLDMSEVECRSALRSMELSTFAAVVSTLRAGGVYTQQCARLLTELAQLWHIPAQRRRAELRRAAHDEQLNTIAHVMHGGDTGDGWLTAGRHIVPPLSRTTGGRRSDIQSQHVRLADAVCRRHAQLASRLLPPRLTRSYSPDTGGRTAPGIPSCVTEVLSDNITATSRPDDRLPVAPHVSPDVNGPSSVRRRETQQTAQLNDLPASKVMCAEKIVSKQRQTSGESRASCIEPPRVSCIVTSVTSCCTQSTAVFASSVRIVSAGGGGGGGVANCVSSHQNHGGLLQQKVVFVSAAGTSSPTLSVASSSSLSAAKTTRTDNVLASRAAKRARCVTSSVTSSLAPGGSIASSVEPAVQPVGTGRVTVRPVTASAVAACSVRRPAGSAIVRHWSRTHDSTVPTSATPSVIVVQRPPPRLPPPSTTNTVTTVRPRALVGSERRPGSVRGPFLSRPLANSTPGSAVGAALNSRGGVVRRPGALSDNILTRSTQQHAVTAIALSNTGKKVDVLREAMLSSLGMAGGGASCTEARSGTASAITCITTSAPVSAAHCLRHNMTSYPAMSSTSVNNHQAQCTDVETGCVTSSRVVDDVTTTSRSCLVVSACHNNNERGSVDKHPL